MDSDQSTITLFSGHNTPTQETACGSFEIAKSKKEKAARVSGLKFRFCENARSRLASNSTVYTSVAGVNFSKRLRLRFPQFKS